MDYVAHLIQAWRNARAKRGGCAKRELAQAVKDADGWGTLVDEDGMTMLIKQQEPLSEHLGQDRTARLMAGETACTAPLGRKV